LLDDKNNDLREEVYELLYRRGYLNEYTENIDERNKIITKLAQFIKENISDSSREYYHIMKEKIESEDTDAKKVLEYIKNNLAPKDVERHKLGEVFTPLELVDEMLSKLPDEVWSDSDLKWLDPANGIGNFPIKAIFGEKGKYAGLDVGLTPKIPDREKRLEHIITNMLYMIDINANNNKQCATLLKKICPNAKPNIEIIDETHGFLTSKPISFGNKEQMEFDIIFGNPPYQSGAVKGKTSQKTLKARKKEGLELKTHRNLWIPFLKKILTTNILVLMHLVLLHQLI
jgi:hypothetical protein